MSIIQHTPYENIVIGNFLYGLGLSLGTKAGPNTPTGSINNTQQTPLDPILADVWISYPGISRLFEFKRREAGREKDIEKSKALNDVLRDQPSLQPVSRRIHWFAEIFLDEVNGLDLNMSPYIDFNQKNSQRVSMSQYIANLTAEAMKPPADEPSATDVSMYLQVVGQLAEASSTSSGGLLVNVEKSGTLRYFTLSDIRDLRMQHTKYLANEYQRTLGIENTRDKAAEFELEQAQHTRGMRL